MKKRSSKYILGFIGVLIGAIAIFGGTNKDRLQDHNLGDNIMTSPLVDKGILYKEIETYGNEHRIEPIDAVVDRVWKAIPGYNGLEVDIEASYEKMKTDNKFDESKIVYKEISPRIHLDDLEANPIFRGNPEKSMVTFLINVAWGDEYIPKMLESLDKHKVKATFFFDGSWVKKTPELIKEIHIKGHEIGNHAYSHPDLQKRSETETLEELKKTNDVIKETINVEPKWFGPPSGSFNQTTVNVADRLGMKTILWTLDTIDWRKPPVTEMVTRILSGVENGSMILMHPTQSASEGLEDMIVGIKEKGFKIGTVGDLVSEKRLDVDR